MEDNNLNLQRQALFGGHGEALYGQPFYVRHHVFMKADLI